MKLEPIEFDLGDGTTISIETTNSANVKESEGELTAIGIVEKTVDTLKDSLAPLRSFSGVVRDALASASPDETQVEFGVKVDGKSNLIVTAGGVEANLKVTLKWKRNIDEQTLNE